MLFRTFLQDIVLASALLLTAHTAQASPVAQAAQCGPGLTPCGPDCFRESEGLYHCENGQLKQGPAPSNPPPSNQPSAPVGGAPPANPNGRTIQVVNKCTQDIWIGMQGNPLPRDGGFFLPRGGVENVQVPSKWEAGRIWARTGCTTQSNGRLVCATGDCGSDFNGFGIACKGIGGQAPATLAEFTLLDGGRTDFYDLSNVDGHNIGIQIDAFGTRVNNPDLGKFNCGNPTCRMDTSKCPPELQMTDSTGHTSCAAVYAAAHNAAQRAKFPALQNIFNNADTLSLVSCSCDCGPNCGCQDPRSKHCCSPYNNDPNERGGKCRVEEWPLSTSPGAGSAFPARYDQVFKNQCPDAYSWQFDDHKSTYQCFTANYRVTFCP
ncbi:uncharacterized protein SPPG_09028 [Spizellomyces punctatus DAOM BR117]|uniref:Thaumatin-like protein n=1 Tax=Spizellomyces punctatus (strain DAOM BR117) TaxID=645134 RepID=A0A0L0HLS1_SPIPD|nr:uncharacterized protein SPPG_09028 [Spizellomyces punctatus DAOM BR117]KND02008.1 hypothetical protein SPPG_09028 [Spizellomyces punctatus DAOM BR117]|eukprot:XP_016610047.1 hypothetical protein SPPG_09028 [Spizellomyces punctatus DAOM BR117]